MFYISSPDINIQHNCLVVEYSSKIIMRSAKSSLGNKQGLKMKFKWDKLWILYRSLAPKFEIYIRKRIYLKDGHKKLKNIRYSFFEVIHRGIFIGRFLRNFEMVCIRTCFAYSYIHTKVNTNHSQYTPKLAKSICSRIYLNS